MNKTLQTILYIDLLLSTMVVFWLTEGKIAEKMEIQEFEYLENKKRFLGEIKSTFHNLFRAIIWLK